MIVPLWVALPALAAAAGLGWGAERALRWRGEGGWATRIAAGASLALAALVHPALALALAVLFVIEARGSGEDARELPSRAPSVVLGAAVVIVAARPPAPLYWDEHVWLAKVRLGVLALRAAALDPGGDLVPRGYPIVGSLAEILLAAGRTDVPSMVAGAAAWLLFALSLALAVVPAERRAGWAIAMGLVPLVWVHARSAYLDLPVGLFALAIAGGLARRARWALRVAMLAAFLAAGCKDEGAVHALAIASAHALAWRDRAALREGALVIAAALVAALGWRALLVAHGVANEDHALDGAGLARGGAIARELARAACDVRSWGVAWPLALGAAVASAGVRSAQVRAHALALIAQVLALTAALLLGGGRLTAFALGGTLVNRLWMQLVPIAALVVVDVALAPRRQGSRISNTAEGCHSG